MTQQRFDPPKRRSNTRYRSRKGRAACRRPTDQGVSRSPSPTTVNEGVQTESSKAKTLR
ncbi:hypothetical protein Plhal304r1_c067g0155091 [Plasmopara halstedii]